MHHFQYRHGALHAEDVSLADIASDIGTPFYCYSTATLERHYRVFAEAFAGTDTLICYSVKACPNIAVLKTLAALGAGMDIVSEGELRRAQAAHVPSDRIVFSGIGKTPREMKHALQAGIYAFNVESEPELEALNECAVELGMSACIAFRVNPDIDPKTHHKIATGKAENKFGVPFDSARALYNKAAKLPGIDPCGIHMHIGSQIVDLSPFRAAFALLRQLHDQLSQDGIAISFVNLGGGLGIPYRDDEPAPPPPAEYAKAVRQAVEGLNVRLIFEPGRMIAGNAGLLVTRVVYVKRGAAKTFIIVDAAMNDLIRPTLYDAYHEIWPVAKAAKANPPIVADVVGPVCETGDFLAQGRSMPGVKEGDLLAIMTAGAYGASQSSNYNTRPLVAEILVRGKDYAVVRPRQEYDAIIEGERIPDWLTGW